MATTKTLSVYEKLLKVQVNLTATKDKRNDFGKYNYRNAETILRNLRPYMNEYGFVVILKDSIECVNERYYVKATAIMIDIESGKEIEAYAYARESTTKKGMDDAQVSGATSSYARKYALCALFAIDDGEDNDSPEYQEKVRKAEEASNKRKTKLNELGKLMKNKNITEEQIKVDFNIAGKISELDFETLDGIVKKIKQSK